MDTVLLYPVLLIPKKCTTQEVTDNTFINLSITTSCNEVFYSGFCKIELLDSYDADIREASITSALDVNDIDHIQVVEASTYSSYPPYSQSQVWIDPDHSISIFNNNETPESQSEYSVYHQTHSSDIREASISSALDVNDIDQIQVLEASSYFSYPPYSQSQVWIDPDHSPSVFNNYEIPESQSSYSVDHQTSIIQLDDTNPTKCTTELNNSCEVDEFECGVFVSHLFEDLVNEKEVDAIEERNIGLQSEDDALKQLMSSDIQSMSKQQKTILFLGHDSHFGQTTEKITINDPSLECVAGDESDQVIVVDNKNKPNKKTYQCDKCMQIFNQMAAFKQHMVVTHKYSKVPKASTFKGEVKFECFKCGKRLKNQEKFELHCLGHGNPDRECSNCGKVLASKYTLRTHMKIHDRQHQCDRCTKAFSSRDELLTHSANVHFVFVCVDCEFTADKYEDLVMHKHHCQAPPHACNDVSCGPTKCANSPLSTFAPSTLGMTKRPTRADIRKADSIIAKVNKVFRKVLHAKKAYKDKSYKKACDVCSKTFDRRGDLKRHLIEHLIRSTLAKNPVNKHGMLNIQCEICNEETFNKVDTYKAHLREHAKLTLYQCTLCNKSFSDSSNFSKHKKVHGATCFQCELCRKKFTSKKMIIQHMEYHNNNSPIPCFYCNKEFHFESMLKKHIKYAHTKEMRILFRCKFCHQYFKSPKEKWDHEWNIHNARKEILDCQICGSKFRKYSDLKRHYNDTHGQEIPRAKELLKNKRSD